MILYHYGSSLFTSYSIPCLNVFSCLISTIPFQVSYNSYLQSMSFFIILSLYLSVPSYLKQISYRLHIGGSCFFHQSDILWLIIGLSGTLNIWCNLLSVYLSLDLSSYYLFSIFPFFCCFFFLFSFLLVDLVFALFCFIRCLLRITLCFIFLVDVVRCSCPIDR